VRSAAIAAELLQKSRSMSRPFLPQGFDNYVVLSR
jgi:hypothetical protein